MAAIEWSQRCLRTAPKHAKLACKSYSTALTRPPR